MDYIDGNEKQASAQDIMRARDEFESVHNGAFHTSGRLKCQIILKA